MSHLCCSFSLTQPLIPPKPQPPLAAGIFSSPQWITNDPVCACATFSFRLTPLLQTNLTWLLLLSSVRLQIIDYHPNPHGSLPKQLHSNMMRLFKTSSVWRERSISSFAGKKKKQKPTNDVTRDAPQPTEYRVQTIFSPERTCLLCTRALDLIAATSDVVGGASTARLRRDRVTTVKVGPASRARESCRIMASTVNMLNRKRALKMQSPVTSVQLMLNVHHQAIAGAITNKYLYSKNGVDSCCARR